ncbi:hypothetical protein QKT49_gp065 [Acanthamoeba castellanii medusavirus]|uniref:Uncharacterized protein n=1 Tax=Acanthamoeba castellanii medusavirus J1 TaxID=3114988 RepID=A0A3T1CWM7_9VIRU|nr:hypothetical protein QKT49_gp065 [Acanthamoeba castellanii medusavirus]BBI30205.1 hypothetical protein [Acanthamoeba castellanii medusavirus J1]
MRRGPFAASRSPAFSPWSYPHALGRRPAVALQSQTDKFVGPYYVCECGVVWSLMRDE